MITAQDIREKTFEKSRIGGYQTDHQIKEECKRKKKTRIISCRGNSYVYRDPRRIFI